MLSKGSVSGDTIPIVRDRHEDNDRTPAKIDPYHNGEKILTDKPRIKISTIHKAKGGEADNVALLLDSSRACAESPDQDGEVRTFYVGLTRAKKALHLIESHSQYGFRL